MTQKKKRLEKIRQNVRNVSLEEFEALINDFGYIEKGGKHTRAIIGNYTLPYKAENPVKSCYLKELLDIIDSL